MQWNDIYVSGSAAWLGAKEDVRAAVADGRYDAEECNEDDYVFARVAGDEAPPDMAVAAGSLAVQRSGVPVDEFALILHASVGFPGLDHWTAASYVQAATVRGRGSAVDVKQASNGGMASLELGAAYLAARSGSASALLTTADKYALPAFDRYGSDKGIVRSDGATGLVLTKGHGVARLLSTAVVGDAAHEGLYRGTGAWATVPGTEGWPIDLRRRRKEYLSTFGGDIMELVQAITQVQQETMTAALADAGVDGGDVAWYVFPNVGRSVQDWELRKTIGIEEAQTTWHWGREVGHIGAGDQIAGLTHLLESRTARAGDRVVLSGVGAGFSFGCAVLEIVQPPEDWTPSAS